jgi:hypothetical protein
MLLRYSKRPANCEAERPEQLEKQILQKPEW